MVTYKKQSKYMQGKDLEGGGWNQGNREAAGGESKKGFGNKECGSIVERTAGERHRHIQGGFSMCCHMVYKGSHFLGLPTKPLVKVPPSRSCLEKSEACCNLITLQRVQIIRHRQVCLLMRELIKRVKKLIHVLRKLFYLFIVTRNLKSNQIMSLIAAHLTFF